MASYDGDPEAIDERGTGEPAATRGPRPPGLAGLRARRTERLAQGELYGHPAEKVAETILEDLFTGPLDWALGEIAYQVGYADIELTRLGIKHLVVEVKRPGALAWNCGGRRSGSPTGSRLRPQAEGRLDRGQRWPSLLCRRCRSEPNPRSRLRLARCARATDEPVVDQRRWDLPAAGRPRRAADPAAQADERWVGLGVAGRGWSIPTIASRQPALPMSATSPTRTPGTCPTAWPTARSMADDCQKRSRRS